MHQMHQQGLDKKTSMAIRTRGQVLQKEMVKKDQYLKNGKRNVTLDLQIDYFNQSSGFDSYCHWSFQFDLLIVSLANSGQLEKI